MGSRTPVSASARINHIQNTHEQVCCPLVVSHLLLSLNVEFIAADQLQHLLRPQAQELVGHRDLHEVLLQEAVGRVVQSCTHHGLGELTHTQTVLGV